MKTILTIFFIICVVTLDSSNGNSHEITSTKIVKGDFRKYGQSNDETKDFNDFVNYYRLIMSDKGLRKAMPMIDWNSSWLKNVMSEVLRSGAEELRSSGRIGPDRDFHGRFTGGPCNCSGVVCICCSYFNVFGYRNKTCTRLEYDPDSGNVNLNVKVKHPTEFSDHYHATFHANKVKTKCVLVPIPYLETGTVDMCMGFYNVTQPAVGILHLCMAVNVRYQKNPVMTLFYDCMDMGHDLPAKPAEGDYDYPVINKPGPEYYKFPSTSPSPPSSEEPYDNEFYPKPKKKKKSGILDLTPSEINGIASLLTKLLV